MCVVTTLSEPNCVNSNIRAGMVPCNHRLHANSMPHELQTLLLNARPVTAVFWPPATLKIIKICASFRPKINVNQDKSFVNALFKPTPLQLPRTN
jgi:hypothetical protein